jgi:hypothetical protein
VYIGVCGNHYIDPPVFLDKTMAFSKTTLAIFAFCLYDVFTTALGTVPCKETKGVSLEELGN